MKSQNERLMMILATIAWTISIGCAGPTIAERRASAADSIAALQAADFEKAKTDADTVLLKDPKNPFSALVRAVTLYKKTLHDLFLDVQSAVLPAVMGQGFNERYLKFALENADKAFVHIDQDLKTASAEPEVDLELCLACWQYDWNRNGEVDDRDMRLLAIEKDWMGNSIDENDPRSRPTFRFDQGDVLWARAFIAFHRAVVSLAGAFDFNRIFQDVMQRKPERIRIPLLSKEKVTEAKQHILAGLNFSDQSREAYLAETDDDREWLPNPRQKNHPIPMTADDALYDTWRHMVSDVRALVNGEEGLSLKELAQLGDIQWDNPPSGYLDVGRMFSEPADIVIDVEALEDIDHHENADAALRSVLGKFRADKMKHSLLPGRLDRIKNEVDKGQETIEQKLRYLLWVN
jgi:hypothetical protein